MSELSEKKNGFRFNFIDVILLLILIAAGTMLFLILRPSQPESTVAVQNNVTDIVYVIEARDMRSEFKGNVNIGDSVVDAVGLHPIGEVIDVTYSDAEYVYESNYDGKIYYTKYPDRINITMKIKASAQIGSTYSIGGFKISVGERVYFRTPNLTGSSFCVSIETENAE